LNCLTPQMITGHVMWTTTILCSFSCGIHRISVDLNSPTDHDPYFGKSFTIYSLYINITSFLLSLVTVTCISASSPSPHLQNKLKIFPPGNCSLNLLLFFRQPVSFICFIIKKLCRDLDGDFTSPGNRDSQEPILQCFANKTESSLQPHVLRIRYSLFR
jgi:hypothetical protein